MNHRLLPERFDEALARAVSTFWKTRSQGSATQGGTRGQVIDGKNLDGFLDVVALVAAHVGLPGSSLHVHGRTGVVLPGYFRPSKTWDVVMVHEERLLAVLEFKSQVGSFGNNFNNRSEEAIGSAHDLWTAARHDLYHPANAPASSVVVRRDPRPPFVGYLMVLEDSPRATQPVTVHSRHFLPDPVFQHSSYAGRYCILCERLMSERLYSSAALIISPSGDEGIAGTHRSLSEATSARSLFARLAAHLAGEMDSAS